MHTLCLKKVSHLMFDNNFSKCGPIFKILSPGDLGENSLYTLRIGHTIVWSGTHERLWYDLLVS